MPLYQYVCSEGHAFEEITSLETGEKRLKEPCPVCGAELARPFSTPAVHMRGYSEGDARHRRGMSKVKEKK